MEENLHHAGNKTGKNEILKFAGEILLNMIAIGAMVLIIRAFLIAPFQVYGPSMCDTLNNYGDGCRHSYGEYLIIYKLGYIFGDPKRGDIIVFKPPYNGSEFFIKRVIGLPGETLKLKNGNVYIYNSENPDGFKLEEPYLNGKNKENTVPLSSMDSFTIPEKNYFVLGDNRTESSDSRSCFMENQTRGTCAINGTLSPYLPEANIEGRAAIVLWPFKMIRFLGQKSYN